MAKRDLRKIVLATYREPKRKPKRCGTCKYIEGEDDEGMGCCGHPSLTICDPVPLVLADHGVCDAWGKRKENQS